MGNNDYNNRETECVSFSQNIGEKLMFFLIGGGIGAALALLFAPKSGRELRSDIADMAETGYEETLSAAHQLKETGAKYFYAAKETGSEVADIVAAGASALKSEFRTDAGRIGAIVEDSARRAANSAKSIDIG
ncbi:MAG: YtxH domain-containing protein [Acidobacteriota bacterium]